MTSQERADLHVIILQTLRAKAEWGMPEDGLKNAVRLQGFDLALPALQSELRLLGDKSWIASWAVDLGLKRWRLTALGESKLAEAGL